MKQLERILKGLANRRRLAIIKLLTRHKELPVASIADHIRLSFTSTSKHLSLLHNLDIIDRRQESLTVYYHLSDSLPLVVKLLLPTISNSRE
ncbi:MAG: metalloregulator ArsR/SmtB family transcription factor [Patescibacteria group bacterium]